MNYTLEEKIKLIQNSKELGEVPLDAMPYMQSDEYYFVSYSHRDYKKVYCDILRLQSLGINVWYDRGLPAGKNWQDIADEAISKYSCVGVIFYISENSLISEAVGREIAFVKSKQKDYLSINIPAEGENAKSLSASAMLNSLKDKIEISQDKQEIIEEAFNDSVLFVDYNASPEFKAEKIRLLKRPPVLQYEIKYDRLKGGKMASVNSVLDLFAKEISVPPCIEFDGSFYPVKEIGECAFANCKFLKRINFSKDTQLYVKEHAFYGCESLVEVDAKTFKEIGDCAFLGCSSLEKIILSSDTKVGNGVFGGTKLKNIQVVKVAGEELIEGINRSVFNKGYDVLIGNASLKKYGYAFNEKILLYDTPNKDGELNIGIYHCEKSKNMQSEEFVNDETTVFAIGDSTFLKRDNLQMVSAVPSIRVIGAKAFEGCNDLRQFNYVVSNSFMQFFMGISYKSALNLKQNFHVQPLCIGEYAFADCASMQRVDLPPFVKINEYGFAHCLSLQTVQFAPLSQFSCSYSECKNSYIGEYAFYNCVSLERIEIPQTVKQIKRFAFGNCKRLSRITLYAESNLNSIDKTAFLGCEQLNKISFNGTIAQFLQINQVGEGAKLQQQFLIVCLDGTV